MLKNPPAGWAPPLLLKRSLLPFAVSKTLGIAAAVVVEVVEGLLEGCERLLNKDGVVEVGAGFPNKLLSWP